VKAWLKDCDQGVADYRLAVIDGAACGLSPEDVLRAYLDDHDAVLAVIPETPRAFTAIKLAPEGAPPVRWGFVPVRNSEEAASLSRRFGNVWRAH
jgi:hypothetical protein